MSIGDLLAQATAGGPQGGSPAPSGNPVGASMPQGQQMAPAQVYGADPTLAPILQAYMQMHEQDRRANGIDRGLAMMAASFGPLQTRAAIMDSAQPQDDRIGALNEAMPLIRQQQMAAAAPAMAQALGLGGGTAGGSGTAGAGGGAAGAGSGAFGGGTGIDPRLLAALPPDVLTKLWEQRMTANQGIQTQLAEEKNKDLLDAQQKTPLQVAKTDEMLGRLNDIQNSPALKDILSSPTKRAVAQELMAAKEGEGGITNLLESSSAWAAGLTSEDKALIANMKQLSNQAYGDAFQSTGSRRTQTEVANLRAGLSQITNLQQPYDTYVSRLGDYKQQLQIGKANALGASQQLDAIPDELKPYVSREYLPGGALYSGVGGQWASDPKFAFRSAGSSTTPATVGSPDDVAKLAHGTPFIVPEGPLKGQVRYAP